MCVSVCARVDARVAGGGGGGLGTHIRMLEPRSLRAKAVAGVPKLGGGPPAALGDVKAPPTPTGLLAGVRLPPANALFLGSTKLPGPDMANGARNATTRRKSH